MIIVMKQNAPLTEIERLEVELREKGFQVDRSRGSSKVVLGLVGDTTSLDERDFLSNEWVDKVMRVQEPYKRASRAFHPQDSVIDVAGVKVGGKKLVVMAGPCSIETPAQIGTIASAGEGNRATKAKATPQNRKTPPPPQKKPPPGPPRAN